LDARVLQAQTSDPAWQAEWELLALLIAVDTWLPNIRAQPCVLQTDALAALFDVARAAGRTPLMNALSAELTLRLEAAQVAIVPIHLSGTLNFQCDALSRLSQGASVPASLRQIKRASSRLRCPSFFWAWPREILGGSNAAGGEAFGQGACSREGAMPLQH